MKLHVLLVAAAASLAALPSVAKPAEALSPGAPAATAPTRQGERTNNASESRPGASEAGERAKLSSNQPLEMKPAPGGGPGKVWVNTQARVYHCEDDPLYGRTRKGTYMTESRARASGARPLLDRVCS